MQYSGRTRCWEGPKRDRRHTWFRRNRSFRDIPDPQLAQIAHFFEHYKDLEPGKWVKIEGWYDADEAKREISDSIDRYNHAKKKPNF